MRLVSGVASPTGDYEVAVMTVKADVADDVFGMIRLVRPKSFTHYGIETRRVVRGEGEDATATLVATLKPKGLVITVR